MKVNKEYVLNEAYKHYRSDSKMFIYEELAKDIGVGTRTITRFLDTQGTNMRTLLGIQELLQLNPSKIFI